MQPRRWTLEEPRWGWPDNVDKTGADTASGYRYIPIKQTCPDGYWWNVARVTVDEGDDEMLADARLVAAAPDLLAALIRMRDAFSGSAQCKAQDDAWAMAQDAIEKAGGE